MKPSGHSRNESAQKGPGTRASDYRVQHMVSEPARRCSRQDCRQWLTEQVVTTAWARHASLHQQKKNSVSRRSTDHGLHGEWCQRCQVIRAHRVLASKSAGANHEVSTTWKRSGHRRLAFHRHHSARLQGSGAPPSAFFFLRKGPARAALTL